MPSTWAFFIFGSGKKGYGMEPMRSTSLSLVECLAVMAALGLQLASLLRMLHGFAAH